LIWFGNFLCRSQEFLKQCCPEDPQGRRFLYPRWQVQLFLSARIPAKWNRFADKDSRQINILEQILIAKVFNFGGICSRMLATRRTKPAGEW
jgi:hypothetical protein